MSTITLTTDFGLSDWYVGAMKGAILRINPRAAIVDITHDISPGNLQAGAFALAASYRSFPKNTIHVAVVDPGVGSDRRPLLIQTKDFSFIGPDNGLLSFALLDEQPRSIRCLNGRTLWKSPVSNTFHGRDIFGPAAAHLSQGMVPEKLGKRVGDYIRLRWPAPHLGRNQILGEILYTDRFGNLITNIPKATIQFWALSNARVRLANSRRQIPIVELYESAPEGRPLALFGSTGFLEIAINGGSAANVLGLKEGDKVRVLRKSSKSVRAASRALDEIAL